MRNLAVIASLRHTQYRRLWLATLLSTVASWTVLTGRGWVAFGLHNHSSTVGLVVFASMLPYLLVTPIAGVLADRSDRRGLLIGSLIVSLTSGLALAGYVLTGGHEAWPLVVLAFLNGAARSVEIPAAQSMVPGMVPEADLLNAVALGRLATHGSRLIGPLLAAPLLDHGGAAGAFILASALYAVAVFQVLRVDIVVRAANVSTNAGRQLIEGVRYVLRDRVVLLLIVLVFFHCGLSMAYDAVLPVMARDVLGVGGSAYSWLVMMIGLGSLIGTFALAGMPRGLHRGWLLFTVGILSGGSVVVLAFAGNWATAVFAATLVGGSQAMFMALTNVFLQIVTPDRVRGRVLSLYLMVGGGVMAFANLGTGRLADAYGVLPVLALPGLAFMAVVAVSMFGPSLRGVYRRQSAPVAVH